MVVGESRVTNSVLRMLKMTNSDSIDEIDTYVSGLNDREFVVFESDQQVNNVFGELLINMMSSLSYDELLTLRSYTGYNFKNINASLRGTWSYEENGHINNKKEYTDLAYSISNIIDKFEMSDVDFCTFRGTTLDSFSSYGINNINDLYHLKGKFMYELGFTSTSMLEDSCFYNRKLDDGRFCNIMIKYFIPSESNDGVLLFNDEMSYSTSQAEFVLNSGSLSKVIDVEVNENTAILTVVYIPKCIYDIGYKNNKSKK